MLRQLALSVSPVNPQLKSFTKYLLLRQLHCFHTKTGETSLLLLHLYCKFLYIILFCLYLFALFDQKLRLLLALQKIFKQMF